MGAAAKDPMSGVENSLEKGSEDLEQELDPGQEGLGSEVEQVYETGKEYAEETVEYMEDHPFEMGLYGGMVAIDPAAAVIAEGLEIAGEEVYDRAESFWDSESHHIYTDILH